MGKKENNSVTTTTSTTVTTVSTTTTPIKSRGGFRWWKVWVVLALIAAAFVGGMWIEHKYGEYAIPKDPIYLPGDTITVDVPYPVPVSVVKPCDTADVIARCVKDGRFAEMFPERERIVEVEKLTKADTTEILRDWAAIRKYEETVYDTDTTGSAVVRATVQYNRISSISAEVVPMVKAVGYELPPRKFVPAVGLGFSTIPSVMVEGGGFINDKYGVFATYQRIPDRNVFGISGMVKF